MMVRDDLPEKAYAFDLHLVCGGYAYFSAISGCVSRKKDHGNEQSGSLGRDVRKPCDDIIVQNLVALLRDLRIDPFYVHDLSSFQCWLLHRGWAIVNVAFAQAKLEEWLTPRPCITDALGSFTDERIAANSALSHRTSRARDAAFERDGQRCLLCDATTNLTMHHVKAFSNGGETTSRNLVALCGPCHQKPGTAEIADLYDLAGIPHAFDHGFLRGDATADAITKSLMITKNLMHTRCVLA